MNRAFAPSTGGGKPLSGHALLARLPRGTAQRRPFQLSETYATHCRKRVSYLRFVSPYERKGSDAPTTTTHGPRRRRSGGGPDQHRGDDHDHRACGERRCTVTYTISSQ